MTIRVNVAGVDYPFQVGTLAIENVVQERSTCDVTIEDRNWLSPGAFQDGQVVRVFDNIPAPVTQQFEDQTLGGGAYFQDSSTHTGYRGTGYIGIAGSGAFVQGSFSAPYKGGYDLVIRYSNGGAATQTLSLYVRGAKICQLSFPVTTDWNTWAVLTVPHQSIDGRMSETAVNFEAGANDWKVQGDTGDTYNVNLDEITFSWATSVSGQSVDGPCLFAGLLLTPEDDWVNRQHSLRSADWHALIDRRLIAGSWQNRTVGSIVREVIRNTFSQEGVFDRNLVSSNPNFETDLSSWTTSGSGTWSRDATTGAFGAASAKLVASSQSSLLFDVNQMIPLYVGLQITMSLYARTAALAVQSAAFGFRCFDSSKSNLLATRSSGIDTGPADGGQWRRYTTSWIVSAADWAAGLRWAQPFFGAANNFTPGTWWFDAVLVELGPPSSSPYFDSSIQDGPTVADYQVAYAPGSQFMDDLASLSGFWWDISPYRGLTFAPATLVSSPWDVSNADARWDSVRVKNQNPVYLNAQLIQGGLDLTALQSESIHGDGSAQTFVVAYPLAKVPTIYINGVQDTSVGILGVDTGKHWYWNLGSNTVAQDFGQARLIATDTLRIDYYGQVPTLSYAISYSEQAIRKARASGSVSGIVENVISDSALKSRDSGLQKAASRLAEFARDGVSLEFQTRRPGLAPGQSLNAALDGTTLIGAEEFLIKSVHITDQDGAWLWYSIAAVDGPVDGSWTKFFELLNRKAIAALETANATLSVPVPVLTIPADTWTWTESVTTTVRTCSFADGTKLANGTWNTC